MRLHELPVGGRRRKKRRGRGNASGRGTYSGRGIKGQKARAGARIRTGFEGGQTRLFQRLPKRRGGEARSPRSLPVSIELLERSFPAGAVVNIATLKKSGLVPAHERKVKILGEGTLTKALTVLLPASASAKKKIEEAGGRVEIAAGA